MKKHNKYALLGLKALERATSKVAENARKNGYKIPVWKNGRVEYEIPEIGKKWLLYKIKEFMKNDNRPRYAVYKGWRSMKIFFE